MESGPEHFAFNYSAMAIDINIPGCLQKFRVGIELVRQLVSEKNKALEQHFPYFIFFFWLYNSLVDTLRAVLWNKLEMKVGRVKQV